MPIRTKDAARAWRANEDRKYSDIAAAGAAQISNSEPVATAGLFAEAMAEWEPGKSYEKNAAFVYDNAVFFTRQAVTAAAHQPPGSTGMEAIYGVRPIPDDNGVYPYAYNMAASVGMRVRSAKDGAVYTCYRAIDPLLYDPADIQAHFEEQEQ